MCQGQTHTNKEVIIHYSYDQERNQCAGEIPVNNISNHHHGILFDVNFQIFLDRISFRCSSQFWTITRISSTFWSVQVGVGVSNNIFETKPLLELNTIRIYLTEHKDYFNWRNGLIFPLNRSLPDHQATACIRLQVCHQRNQRPIGLLTEEYTQLQQAELANACLLLVLQLQVEETVKANQYQ